MRFNIGDIVVLDKQKNLSDWNPRWINGIFKVISDREVQMVQCKHTDLIGEEIHTDLNQFQLYESKRNDKQEKQTIDILLQNTTDSDMLKTLHYIQEIGQIFKKDISNINILEKFNDLDCSKSEINKIIFELENKKVVKKELSESELNAIEELSKKSYKNYRNKLSNSKKETTREINNLHNLLDGERLKLNNINQMLNNTKDNCSKIIIENIKLLTQHPDLSYLETNNNKIEFLINDEIILTKKNEPAGLDLRVNLGKFTLQIDIIKLDIKLYAYENNIETEGYHHPHFSGGNPCLGTLKEAYNKAFDTFNLKEMVEIILTLVRHYNSDDPYVSLQKFAIESGQIQPNGKILEEENIDKRFFMSCYECEHEWDEYAYDVDQDYDCIEEVECPECGHYNSSSDWEMI